MNLSKDKLVTVLVTGGAGLIGADLCLRLLQKNIDVLAVDNFSTSSGENLKPLRKNPRFTFLEHDITKPFNKKFDPPSRRMKFEIYHLACPTGVHNLGRLSLEMLQTCSIGTKNVLDFALKVNAKVLFTSSSEVYGDPKVFPQDESYTGNVNPVGFRSPYEEGKRFAEALIMAYVRKYNLDARIVRVFNTYGPGMSEQDSRVIGTFLREALAGKPLTVAGKGEQTRTFCYVDDLVEGLILIMKKGKKGEIYNLGSDREVAIKDLAKTVKQVTKTNVAIKFIKRPKHDHNRRLPSIAKVKKLGWRPQTLLTDGIDRTAAWFPRKDV